MVEHNTEVAEQQTALESPDSVVIYVGIYSVGIVCYVNCIPQEKEMIITSNLFLLAEG